MYFDFKAYTQVLKWTDAIFKTKELKKRTCSSQVFYLSYSKESWKSYWLCAVKS